MIDAITALQERQQKAEAKVARLEKSLKSAKNELNDLDIALRVMQGIAGVDTSPTAQSSASTTLDRQILIALILSIGHESPVSPSDAHKMYSAAGGEEIALETFRTTIWRMADKHYDLPDGQYVVRRDQRGYWREPLREFGDDGIGQPMAESQKNEAPEAKAASASEAGGWGVAAPASPSSQSLDKLIG
ncbi:hypothetical protein [Pseudonocardia sp. TMWB2A]|uniref:hypothetical protein n=1 Tax=Pseudonocardia sp. TMWB2A TaxID=687430 RepID=UPI00307DA21E